MTIDMSAEKAVPVTFMQWLIGAALVAVAGAVVWMFIYVAINGPRMQAMAESQKAEEIMKEDRAFCAMLGMNFETPTFATCANVLGQVRRLQEGRFSRDPEIL